MDALAQVKCLVIARRVTFTLKAEDEMEADGLTKVMVYEAILNAVNICKTLRSRKPGGGARETIYVIKGLTFDGFAIYTNGLHRLRHRDDAPDGGVLSAGGGCGGASALLLPVLCLWGTRL